MPKDPNRLAAKIVRLSTEERELKLVSPPVSVYLAKIGRTGGLKGGVERARRLSPKRRRDIARRAAEMRWKSHAK